MRSLAPALLLVLLPAIAGAQARFQSGSFAWTPVITLRDAGLDTNVYNELDNPRRDTTAVLAPQMDGVFDAARFKLTVAGATELVYFQTNDRERSINTRASVRADVPLSRVRPFAAFSFLNARERQNSEIDLRAKRREHQITAGTGVVLTSRAVLELSGRYGEMRYRQGEIFRGVVLSERLDRDNTAGAARILFDLSPLTRFVAEAEFGRDRFINLPALDTDNLRAQVGFEFAPDAIIRGRGTLGFHKMTPVGGQAIGFEGVTASVDLSYTLRGVTKLDVRVARDTSYSLQTQPYYLLTGYGGGITQSVLGPFELLARYHHETMDYPGIPERSIASRVDRTNLYGGGIGIRPGDRFHITFNYEFGERRSELTEDFAFERRRVFTTITYGF